MRSSSISGLELEVDFVPAEGWLTQLAISTADGECDKFDDFVIDPTTGLPVILDR